MVPILLTFKGMDERFDILIVGAGLAGALATRLIGLNRRTLRILLIDAQQTPQHRPCGEYLAPGGIAVIDRAGLTAAVHATGVVPLREVAIVGPHGGWRASFSPVLHLKPFCDHGLGVRRERLDRVLQEGAAEVAELRRGHRLAGMERQGQRWSVSVACPTGTYRIDTALVIGADGRGSAVRHRTGLDRPSRFRRFALVARARGIAHRERVEMHLGALGQIGLCPLGDGEVNLNLLIAPQSAVLLRTIRRDVLLRLALATTPSLAARCHSAVLGQVLASGSLPQRAAAVIDDGVCLVGDAAGFCDPFTGEGMTVAARGAGLLADTLCVLDFDRMPTADDLAPYARAHHSAIGRRRLVGEALQRVLARRRATEGLAALIGRIPMLGHLLVADAAGFTPQSQ